jgi:signal transduction histidine kinase
VGAAVYYKLRLSLTASRYVLVGSLMLAIGLLGWLVFGAGELRQGVQGWVNVPGARVELLSVVPAPASFEDVANLPEDAWRPWTQKGYASANSSEALWMRATVVNASESAWEGVWTDTSYFSDRVELWWRIDDGGWRQLTAGGTVAGADKPLWDRKAAFALTVPAKAELSLYWCVTDAYRAHVQPMWWKHVSDYIEAQAHSLVIECLCYGALVSLVLYNFVLWLRLRFADTGYYVLTAAASAALNLIANGVPSLLGWRMTSPAHETAVAAAFAIGSIFMVQFARVFLGTRTLLPRVDVWLTRWRWILVAVSGGVGVMPWMSTPGWIAVAAVGSVCTDAVCLVVSLLAWRRGANHARFFVLAFGVLGVSAMPLLASVIAGGVVPGTAFGLLAGRTMEMLLLSFAVADRFAHTQQRLVEETEQRRLLQQTYSEELAIEVSERTRELQIANSNKDRMLSVIGHDLRSPLIGLMRLADRSEGSLAEHVSQSGRTMLLMIEDLVLWARLRGSVLEKTVISAEAMVQPAVTLHQALAEQEGIVLVVVAPAELRVFSELVLTQTLVRNLLANALKFAKAWVELRADAEVGGAVRISVRNDGAPLEPEVAARFAAGADEPLTATGGLGLRLCREICSVLDTQLVAGVSADGRTEFSFMLPRATQLVVSR